MDPTYTLKPQLRIKNTNIYLDETVTLIQYIVSTIQRKPESENICDMFG